MIKNKIKTIQEIELIISKNKKKNKKIILSHGVFDLLHVGHINHFEEAKKLGDILIVSITAKKYVKKIPGRPYFGDNDRLKSLASLEIVDYVLCNNDTTSINLIKKIKPDFYCKGPDYKKKKNDLTKNISKEIKAINSVKGKIVYTKGITFSSSKLLNQFSTNLSSEQKIFLNKIKKLGDFEYIKNQVDKIVDKKILIVGESIIDQYTFCEALGKSGKESVLSLREKFSEKYLGGVLSIAQNCSTFSNNISILSYLGNEGSTNSYIKKNLNKKIKFKFINKKNSPTILKKRFLDVIDNRKLLGVYNINDDNLSAKEESYFLNLLKKESKKHDATIVLDYGHGLITNKIAKFLSTSKKFVSVNAQVNASNIGFHTLSRYKNIKSLVINATELRHEMRRRDGNIINLGKELKKNLNIKKVVITQGQSGAILINENNKLTKVPAFSGSVVDKIGAGDTLFGVFSICKISTINDLLSLFIASVAAGISTSEFANRKLINKFEILNAIKYYLK